jgi:hypothetical protein
MPNSEATALDDELVERHAERTCGAVTGHAAY